MDRAASALNEVFGKSALSYEQNDGVTICLYSRCDELLPKAAKLAEEVRQQVDMIVIYDTKISESGLKSLLAFPNINDLHLSDTKEWKPELENVIVGLPKLKSVWAQQMNLTNKELAVICKAKQLQCLMADGNKFSAGGCKSLVDLDELFQLSLSGSEINDDDILNLQGKTSLRTLWLKDTNVTEKGLKTLKSTLSSKCALLWSPKSER